MTALLAALVAIVAIGVAAWALVSRAGLERKLGLATSAAERVPTLDAQIAAHADKIAAETKARGEAEGAREELKRQVATQEAALQEARRQLDAEREKRTEAETKLTRMETTQEKERKANDEKLALLEKTRDEMTQRFKVLADEILGQHGEKFTKQNKEQVEALLGPLREQLESYRKLTTEARSEAAKDHAGLVQQLQSLTAATEKIDVDARGLASALRGQSQAQGAWGEMILETILERSGLREGEEYMKQDTVQSDDGQRLRPDVIIRLPGSEGRRLVVDAKVSLTAFDAYVNAEDETTRAVARREHVASLRRHIQTLGGKSYQSAIGSDFGYVVMFVPIEGALAVALSEEPGLTAMATDANVAIATPTTLMIALRTVRSIWDVERRHANADAIGQRAGLIYDKLVGFVEDFQKVGMQMEAGRRTYDDALGKLTQGRGNLLGQVEQLKRLGAKTSKSLPHTLLGDET